jgi:mannose-6-phosphate isomerase-like protein (cupin superfamily)
MTGLRLQGFEVSPAKNFWVGLSHFQPGGGAENSGSAAEKVYVVLSGEISVVTEAGEVTLHANDSCYLAAGEHRSIINRSTAPTAMLVIMSYLPASPPA